MSIIGGDGLGGPPPYTGPSRRIRGTWIGPLQKTLRTYYLTYDKWNDQAGTTHRLKVPPGKFWIPIGGYLTRGVCTCTALVDIRTANNQVTRRLLVLSSGASDTTDIPDNALRVRPNEVIEEQGYINIYCSVAQNADTAFGFAILEGESKR